MGTCNCHGGPNCCALRSQPWPGYPNLTPTIAPVCVRCVRLQEALREWREAWVLVSDPAWDDYSGEAQEARNERFESASRALAAVGVPPEGET